MRKIDKIVFGVLGSLVVLHAIFRMSGNDMIIQVVLGSFIALFPLWEKDKGSQK